MIKEEQIQEQITKLQTEQAALQTLHERMVANFQQTQAEFQQKVAGNQNRFQQITGAIAQLTELLQSANGASPPDGSGN